jgi:hypothetical protein
MYIAYYIKPQEEHTTLILSRVHLGTQMSTNLQIGNPLTVGVRVLETVNIDLRVHHFNFLLSEGESIPCF